MEILVKKDNAAVVIQRAWRGQDKSCKGCCQNYDDPFDLCEDCFERKWRHIGLCGFHQA